MAWVDFEKRQISQLITPSFPSRPQIPFWYTLLRYRAQRHALIAISGTGLRCAAARFRAPVRTAPRGDWAVRRDSGRQCAPHCTVIVRRDSISGAGSRRAARLSRGAAPLRVWARAALCCHRAACRDFGHGFALRCVVNARLNAIPASVPVYLRVHFISSILQHDLAHSSTFRIFAICADRIGMYGNC